MHIFFVDLGQKMSYKKPYSSTTATGQMKSIREQLPLSATKALGDEQYYADTTLEPQQSGWGSRAQCMVHESLEGLVEI